MDEQKYLNMQKVQYENNAKLWSQSNRDPVVGSYDQHNSWPDYDEFLFKGVKTEGKLALEYGCGPGRNIIKFNDRFRRIDGVDIAQMNKEKAIINCNNNKIFDFNYYVTDGKSIPVDDETYDVIFSVICLQHIACHTIRQSIFEDCYRVLKKGGHLCFQMGYGGVQPGPRGEKYPVCGYYDNMYDAPKTNGALDVSITDEKELKKDLYKIGFKLFKFDIRPVGPGDNHKNWIFVRVKK